MALNGNNIYIAVGEGTAATIIAGTRSNEIQTNGELIEISSPTSGKWKEYLDGRSEWSFNTNYLVLANNNVKDVLKVNTKVGIYIMGYEGTANVVILQGEAWIKTCKQTFTRGNLAQGSFAFVGHGELTEPSS